MRKIGPTARIVVFETTGKWAAALRRIAPKLISSIRETRGWTECRAELRDGPHSALIVELTAENLERTVDRLAELQSSFRHVRPMIVGDRKLRSLEWLMRDRGAVDVAFDVQRLRATARLLQRHLAAAPRPELTMRQSIYARLPW